MVSTAVDACRLGPGHRAADIGFGGGVGLELLLAQVLPGGHVVGVDVSDTMVAQARRRFAAELAAGSLTVQQGSITDLAQPDASLDGVITVNTVYFVADLRAAFSEIARVLRPNRRLAVGLGDPDHMASLPFTAFEFRVRPLAEVVAAVSEAGLTVVDRRRGGSGGGSAYHCLVAERR
jgi:ubiquinone/menaquinone biosynthesis C-methylase UbiE